MIDKQSFTYKIVERCEIKADVYTVSDDVNRPVVMWIHGGALITGHRENINPDQIGLYVKAGYTLISIDYRLAPETKLKAIIEDIQDTYKWIREESSHLLNLDPNRIVYNWSFCWRIFDINGGILC